MTGADGALLAETRDVLRDRAPRADPRHGSPWPRRHVRGRRRRTGEGVSEIVVTHPEFPCQDFSLDDQRELAARGCLLERCLSTPLSGKTTWEHVFDGIRAVGVGRTVLASDCGNPEYPPVEDGLALWADRLLGERFEEDEISEMIVGQSRRLAGVDS